MTIKSEFELTLVKCYRALQFILDKKTPAIPRNYEIWYTYVAGEVSALVDAVDGFLAKQGDISQDDLDRVYDRFLCPLGKLAASERIGGRICYEVDRLSGTLVTAAARARHYRDTLDQASHRLSGDDHPEAAKSIIDGVILSTTEMVEHTEALEADLSASRAQVLELKESLAAMQAEALTDPLTGIGNRKRFERDLAAAMETALETGTELCLLIGDVDHFKKFNDLHGHRTGDEVLRQVSRTLKRVSPHPDMVARYGGEEFALILPKTNLHGAVAAANRARKSLATARFATEKGTTKIDRVTMSFGAARHRPDDTVHDFVDRADSALYAAKEAGRDRVRTEAEIEPKRGAVSA